MLNLYLRQRIRHPPRVKITFTVVSISTGSLLSL